MAERELTRRDAIVALTATGVAAGALGTLTWDALEESGDPALGLGERDTLVALAETVYPDGVEGVAAFVETYVVGRVSDRPEREGEIADSARTLEETARRRTGSRFADLAEDRRDSLLREMGLDEANPDPAGIEPARLRYHLVNELLYAFYTSPTGGELVGIENPQGYPGGTDSYRRGPDG